MKFKSRAELNTEFHSLLNNFSHQKYCIILQSKKNRMIEEKWNKQTKPENSVPKTYCSSEF